MNSDFRKAHDFTARWEGGYVNHVHDTGGETNLGVTRGVWQAWCKERKLPVKPMKALTMADVLPLYEARYWPAAAHLPWPLSGVAYDIAVNHGPGNLRAMLTPIGNGGTPAERAARLIDARERFFRNIVKARPDQGVFLKGWLRRVNAQREWLAQQMAPAPRLLLVPKNGGEPGEWNGRDNPYGGVILSDALAEQLRTIYPAGSPRAEYQGLYVYHQKDGDLVLERMPQK